MWERPASAEHFTHWIFCAAPLRTVDVSEGLLGTKETGKWLSSASHVLWPVVVSH